MRIVYLNTIFALKMYNLITECPNLPIEASGSANVAWRSSGAPRHDASGTRNWKSGLRKHTRTIVRIKEWSGCSSGIDPYTPGI